MTPRLTESMGSADLRHRTYDYGRYEGRDWRYFEPLLVRMHPAPLVLDLGAGLGLFLECCQQHEVQAIGIELSREGVQAAAGRRLSIVRGDITQPLPFRDAAFGSALAHHVLEHVPLEKERLILKEVRRTLRPGGFLFAVSPNIHHPQARDDPDHVNLFTPHQLAVEARAAGYTRVELGTNFWRHFWEPKIHLGQVGAVLAGMLWKLAPIDRLAGSASVLAWK